MTNIKKRLIAWRKRSQDFQAPPTAKEELDMQLIKQIAPRRFPSLRQFKYLFKVLDRKEKKSLLISLALCIIAIGLLTVRGYVAATETIPAAGGTYTEGLIGSPRYINPLLAQSNDIDRDISSLVFSGLMKYDAQGNIAPDLASQYRASDDQKVYTIELRDNIYWHDGQPLTVDDVIYTIRAIQDPVLKSPLRVSFSGVEVEKIDRRTIAFTLNNPFPSFLSVLTVGIIPSHIWYPIPTAQIHLAEANIKPVGSGLYRFKSLTKDSMGGIRSITLERSDSWYDKKPYIDTIVFKFYPDVETALDALKNKNVEGVGFLPLEYKSELEQNRSIILHSLDLPQLRALFLNPDKNEVLKDRNIRRALSYSIDREKIVRDVLRSNGYPITKPIYPNIVAEETSAYAFNPDEANKILDEAGWTFKEGATVRSKDTTELKISITVSDQQENTQTASIIKDNWNAIGVAADIITVPKQKIKKDIIERREYQVLLFGQITTSSQDIYAFWHSSQTKHPGNNLSNFANKDIDTYLEELRNTSDPAKQLELYEKFASKLSEEMFAIFLYTPSYVYPVSKKIKSIGQLEDITVPSQRFTTIEDWYIKTKRKWK